MAIDTKPNLSNKKFEQCSNDIMNLSGCTQIYGYFDLESGSTLTICNDAGNNKVLTSDASGIATWQESSVSASGDAIKKEINQTSHGFVVQDVVGYSGGTYNKPIADGTYDGEVLGLVTAVPDINTFEFTQAGYVSDLTGLIASTTYFLSDTTAGLLTSTEPTGDTHISKAVLLAETTTTGWVLPYVGYIITTGDSSGTVATWGTIIGTLSDQTDLQNVLDEKADYDELTASTVYNLNSPATCIVGGVSPGYVLTGKSISCIIQDAFAPYIEPTFSSFGVDITSPMEVGTALSGNKTFTWGTSTSPNVASNSIGICEVGGSLLGSGLANDGSELLDIGIKTNSSPITWTWQITGCSTQDNSFSRNVAKCSIYPYFWGTEICASRPDVTNDLVTGGTLVVANSCGTVTVDFNSDDEWTWFAIPANNPSTVPDKTCWYQSDLSKGTMLVSGSRYPDKQAASVSSSDGCWSGIAYCVYVSDFKSTDTLAVQFRNS